MAISSEREGLVYNARVAMEAERYDEVVEAMKKVVNLEDGIQLTSIERNLLNLGFKNVVDARRSSWRALLTEEEAQQNSRNTFNVEQLQIYRLKIASEIATTCDTIIAIVDALIAIMSDSESYDSESYAHYHKIKGDFFRYLAELEVDDEQKVVALRSKEAYEIAMSVARDELPATSHIRLGVALNLSTLHRDILKYPKTAFWVVKIAFDESLVEINDGELSSDEYKRCVKALMQMRDVYLMNIASPTMPRCTPLL